MPLRWSVLAVACVVVAACGSSSSPPPKKPHPPPAAKHHAAPQASGSASAKTPEPDLCSCSSCKSAACCATPTSPECKPGCSTVAWPTDLACEDDRARPKECCPVH